MNRRPFSVQQKGSHIPMHNGNYNNTETCIFPNRNIWGEPSYYPSQEQVYRYMPMCNHGQYEKENMESYYPSQSLVNDGQLDDGINRTWGGQHVPFETYVNGLEPPSSLHPLYQQDQNEVGKL